MGPIVILDKSALQALSDDELIFLGKHYSPVIPPVLMFEILGDLSKYEDKDNESKFKEIVGKISSGDFKINTNHRDLCLGSLLGYKVDMRMVPIGSGGVPLTASDGSKGVFIDESPEWKLIRKWQQGKYKLVDRIISRVWRSIPRNFDMESYKNEFKKANQDIPETNNFIDLYQSVRTLIMDPDNQDFYLEFLMDEFSIRPDQQRMIYGRWGKRHSLLLCDFSPYAFYCLTISMLFHFGLANDLITTRKTNPIDMEYLYYLPFCMAFISGDKLHSDLCPRLLTGKQKFVSLSSLKEDLKWLSDDWKSLTDGERKKRSKDYGCHPPQHNHSSITYKLWKMHMKPWKVGSGMLDLTKEQQERLMKDLKPMFDAIKKQAATHRSEAEGV
ncbi:MAG: hypothetical protein KAT05_14920 [Spirochaetes bacterium]|nr:hypothetical protein [Spirochaetota bacterium]